jgi:iron complex outermembrane receptor protein
MFKNNYLSTIIAAPFALLSPAIACAQQGTTTDVGRIAVEGQGAAASSGSGLITPEETPKARSSVGREQIERMNGSNIPYQVINLLPGVNATSFDATGLFGGNLRVRGFNSDQMGFTVDGAPVNDSGSFAVFPTEYIDIENLQEIFVTQGSTDTEAPHVGATGGNIGLVVMQPSDVTRLRFHQNLGDLRYYRTFVRLDTGRLLNDTFKAFISFSKSAADKWRGFGAADRKHIDFIANLKVASNSSVSAGFYWNEQYNNNFRTLTKTQIGTRGYDLDFSGVPPVHLTPGPGAQVEAAPADGYYKFNINPFRNYIGTLKGNFQITDKLRLDVEPYYWYGFGTGGNQLTTLAEGNVGTRLRFGLRDINRDGDTADTIMVYRSSVTETNRPGVTVKATYAWANHRVVLGMWYERARHRQTAPATTIDSAGNSANFWLDNPALFLRRQDGSFYQNRDTLTISTGKSPFLQDTMTFFNDKLTVQAGIRHMSINRDFTNFASDGAGAGANYKIDRTYGKTLGSLGVKWQLDAAQSVFANVAQNFKAPGNFSYFGLLTGGAFVGGVLTGASVQNVVVQPETSLNTDIGYRYSSDRLTASGSVFYIDYQNRIANQFDPAQGLTIPLNVGPSVIKGFEAEAGWRIARDWRVYGSISRTESTIKQNLRVGATAYEPTSGKQLPDTPRWMSALSLQYTHGGWMLGTQAKYTGKRYSTLVNDEAAGGYTLFDLNAAYKFGKTAFLKNPQIKLNVHNVFDKQYLALNSGSGSLFTNRATAIAGLPAPSSPSYYTGAPRFASVAFTSDF